MKDYIEERVLQMAQYVAENHCTVRQVATVFCVSKSTAHKDLSERLPILDETLGEMVAQIMDENWDERYIRGGLATRKKYKELNK